MAEPIAFPSTTANLSLPMLFAGQAQKEFALNQSLLIIDALLQKNINATLAVPPQNAEHGETYRVDENASGAWAGHENKLATIVGGSWVFVPPSNGMSVYDRTQRQRIFYNDGWQTAEAPPAPTGGAVVDTEARTMLAALIDALRSIGIFADPV